MQSWFKEHRRRQTGARNNLSLASAYEGDPGVAPARMSSVGARERGSRRSNLWILVAIAILTIPFENEFSFSIGRISVAKLAILPLLFAVVVFQPKQLLSMSKQPVFLCAILFVAWGVVTEFFRPISDFDFILSIFQTVIFAALVGSVASNKFAFRRILISLALVCSLLAVYLILQFYGAVNVDVGSARDAGYLRKDALSNVGLATGLNILAYTVGMGAVIALAQFFGSRSLRAKIAWLSIYVLCAVGSFVPLSRGSFLALVGASLFVLVRNRRALIKPGTLTVLVGAVVLAFSLTPPALTERYASIRLDGQPEETRTGKVEGRTRVFRASIDNFPEYWKMGVGSGYFWWSWGPQKGFRKLGPHNGFFAAWIFYGLPGFLLLSLTCFLAARASPKSKKSSPEATALVGLLVLALFWIMFTHSLYIKSFGVILGLLMGATYQQAQIALRYKWAKRKLMDARSVSRLRRGGRPVARPLVGQYGLLRDRS